jgi:uncharacterized damage-inducible protein DinB
MSGRRARLVLHPLTGSADPEVGRWLAALEEVRRDTLETIAAIPADAVDRDPGDGGDTVGTVLYHVALVELDWVFIDVLGREDEPAMVALLPHDSRNDGGRLTPVRVESLQEHLDRLARARSAVLEELRPMTSADFRRARARAEADISAAWAVFHLIDHEVEHRVRLSALRDAFRD